MPTREARETKEVNLRCPAPCRPKQARDRDPGELTESIEEYTEGIYRLQEELEAVSSGDVAKYMGVSPASATTMLKRLAELEIVTHTPYQGVRLTDRGVDISIALLRRHRLVERLLVDFLELPWDDVHDLACKLEHYISEDVADRIARAMHYPQTCPHGNPVDATKTDDAVRLSSLQSGTECVVARITDERTEFLSYILEIGLVPDAQVTVRNRTPFGDVLTLVVQGIEDPVSIGRDVANSVWVFTGADAVKL
jgi:DtxR family transcriptional regulator, Mn-dependent transcriptional regulator